MLPITLFQVLNHHKRFRKDKVKTKKQKKKNEP